MRHNEKCIKLLVSTGISGTFGDKKLDRLIYF